ncbi:single-stranded-DNA-specific exonuclease RecJ [bacterium]|nr:single-stranded-DNA-specific exonuclease RecJ [bacterium]
MRKKEWEFLHPAPQSVAHIARSLGLSDVVAAALVNRSLDDVESASLFLQNRLRALPDPFLLHDSEKASLILIDAIKTKKKIVIYGDYDVDGITSTVVMYKFLLLLGAHVDYYIPLRLEDGYGLNTYTLEEIATDGGNLVVTVDCGITSWKEVEYAKNLGMNVIVVDHHHVGEKIPDAVAIVNPHQKECQYPFEDMAAVGVAFSLLMVLKKKVDEDGFFKGQLPNLLDYMDIVALGTVADMVPLQESNRIFVKYGLAQMVKNNRPGLVALAQICGVKSLADITPTVISYKMAPRLNAAGRIGNAIKGVDLLLSEDIDEARHIAEELNLTNEYRQQLEADIFEQAVKMVEDGKLHETRSALVLASEKWHPGVIGIVASRLTEIYAMPTLMISIDSGLGRGSARSARNVHIYNIIEKWSGLLVQYGGHKFAAGMTIAEDNIKEFADRFNEGVKLAITDDDSPNVIEISAELPLNQLSPEQVVGLAQLEPYGMNNPEPNFLARKVVITKQSIINKAHIHWKLEMEGHKISYNSIGYGLLHNDVSPPKVGDYIDIIYYPRISMWGGNVALQLYIKDFRLSSETEDE